MNPITTIYRDHPPCTYLGSPHKPQCSEWLLQLFHSLGLDLPVQSYLPAMVLCGFCTLTPDKASCTAPGKRSARSEEMRKFMPADSSSTFIK